MKATLYIIAGPIGNLEDLTFRAKRILEEVDFILAEHPRYLQRLLSFYKIKTSVLSYHQHSSPWQRHRIVNLLQEGKELALMTDAGTPGIADPGNELIQEVRASVESIKIIALPGPSALTTAASLCGFRMDKFFFLGFLPKKKKRNAWLREIANYSYPVIFYESPYRLLKTLDQLADLNQDLEIFVGRELTKKFETTYQGNIRKVISKLQEGRIKGEFVVILNHHGKR
jgi:16S rRNA (cytidine1402-2'-O)-methyltransferase